MAVETPSLESTLTEMILIVEAQDQCFHFVMQSIDQMIGCIGTGHTAVELQIMTKEMRTTIEIDISDGCQDRLRLFLKKDVSLRQSQIDDLLADRHRRWSAA